MVQDGGGVEAQRLPGEPEAVLTREVEVEDHDVVAGLVEQAHPGLEAGRRTHDGHVLEVTEADGEGVSLGMAVLALEGFLERVGLPSPSSPPTPVVPAAGRGPRAVGDAATAAVVGGIVALVLLDGLFAILFFRLGW